MDNSKFVKVPTNLIYMLDCDCLKLMAILIQKESYWENKGKLKDGWFVKTISELKTELECANTKDVRCVIQALVDSGLVSVAAYEKKKMSARFKINWDKVNELNEISLYDMNEFDIEHIRKLSRNSKTTYNKSTKCTPPSPQSSTICTSTIANKDNRNNKDNNAISKENVAEGIASANEAPMNSPTVGSSNLKGVDPCATLRKRACFVNYDYPFSKIVQPIRTKARCANQQLIALQDKLNGIISQHENEIALAETCRKLWDELTSTMFETAFQPANSVEQQKYEEIVQSVDRMGYAIAYVCKRKYLKDATALEASSHFFWMNCVSGSYEAIINQYLNWLIAKYTLDDSKSETECYNLPIMDTCKQIAEKNDYFRKAFEEWKNKQK